MGSLAKRRHDGLSLNDSRQKVREGFLVDWDQTDSEGCAILEEACTSVLSRRRDGELSVRGLVDAVNRESDGKFTKRGERRNASLFVRERLGGTKAWIVDILSPSGDFLVTGSWDSSSPLVKLVGEPPIDIAHLVGTPTEGKCTYWDRHRGWGKILIRGTSMRVFAHCRDIVSDVSSLPRDARVTLVLEQERGNHERQNKYVAKMIRIVDTRNEKDMSDEESDKPI